jgi:uncharacterized protein (TIGR02266 family)
MSDKKQVLIICSLSTSQMYLGVLLNRIWYMPVVATSAEEGVDLAQNTPFSVILFDMDLPEKEQGRILSLLRTDPAVRGIPLVVFLPKDRSASGERLLAQGCSAVITKPLDLSLLYGLLNRLTGQPRATARVPVKMQVAITEGSPAATLTCTNISEGGVFLRTATPLAEGSVITMRFSLPRDPDVIEIAGKVARTISFERRMTAEPGMGLSFLDPSEDLRQKLKNFVQWEMMGDLEWEATI